VGVRIIAKRQLLAMARAHGDCVKQVEDWFAIARKATWHDLSEVRRTFRDTDAVGNRTVFNIKGNAYRLIVELIVEMHYDIGVIYIKHLLTHAEYDKGNWKA
jgi:mRNA interferase HigB